MAISLFWFIASNVPMVDSVRLNLEASSENWFSVVRYAGYAVAGGCALEAPETFITIKRWWLLRFRDIDREETKEEKRSWIVPCAAIGLLIIVCGIVVETYAEDRVSYFDSLLRTHESDKITAAESEAAEATRQAGKAADSATTAHQESDAATKSSTEAQRVARGARKEADSFEADIVSAKDAATRAENDRAESLQRTARLERSLTWRTVTPGQTRSLKAFFKPMLFNPEATQLHGLQIQISYNSSDLEGGEYATDLANALRDSLEGFGVQVFAPMGILTLSPGGLPESGLIMRVKSKDDIAGALLQHALKSVGIDAPGEFQSMPDSTISLFVGVRPKPEDTQK